MKGYTIASILFFSNMLLLYYIFGDIPDVNEMLFYYWLEITIVSSITKVLYYYKKELVFKYTMYLVNSDKSIWSSDYPLYALVPSNFILLLVKSPLICGK
jgi:hypothetical protein